MKPNILYSAVAHFFMLLFVYTGVAKLMEMTTFRLELAASPYLGFAAAFMTWVVPILELLVVVTLFIPASRLKGLYASLALMSVFTLYVFGVYFLAHGLSCSCGGIVENLSPRQHVAFNTACIVLAAIGIRAARHQQAATTPLFRWMSTTLTLLIFCSVSWIVFTAETARPMSLTGREGKVLPAFDLVLPDSVTHFNSGDIPTGKPFIVVDFSPYCPHCRGDITVITKNIGKFQHTHIYLVTSFSIPELRDFYEKFQLQKYPGITVGMDKKDSFLSFFDVHMIPFTAIYDDKKRLSRAITGRADMATLSRCLNE
jgi:hypothetical protein